MSIPVSLSWGKLANGYCFVSPESYKNDIFALITASVAGSFSGVIIGQNIPATGDRDKLWLRTDAFGRPVGFFLFQGQWIYPHPAAPSDSERRIWVGAETDLWSYDGGDGTDPSSSAPTAVSGAMWMRDTDFDFKFPVGAGTNLTVYAADTPARAATSIAVGGVGGAERVKLVQAEGALPSHFHIDGTPVGNDQVGDADNAWYGMDADGTTKFFDQRNSGAAGRRHTSTEAVDAVNTHENMPPYRGVYFIRRTARVYFTAS